MPVSFHIGVLPNRPLQDFVDWVEEAEQLGFEGVWVADSQSIFRDAFSALTLFAEHTKKMMLATGVTNAVTRHPAVLAQSFATLDEISGGRAILGIGVGESAWKKSRRYFEHLWPAKLHILTDRTSKSPGHPGKYP